MSSELMKDATTGHTAIDGPKAQLPNYCGLERHMRSYGAPLGFRSRCVNRR